MSDPRTNPEALGVAWERRVYRPPTKRRLQAEAWTIALTMVAFTWCFLSGIWVGAKILLGLARLLLNS
jgi:hypothetical protein